MLASDIFPEICGSFFWKNNTWCHFQWIPRNAIVDERCQQPYYKPGFYWVSAKVQSMLSSSYIKKLRLYVDWWHHDPMRILVSPSSRRADLPAQTILLHPPRFHDSSLSLLLSYFPSSSTPAKSCSFSALMRFLKMFQCFHVPILYNGVVG